MSFFTKFVCDSRKYSAPFYATSHTRETLGDITPEFRKIMNQMNYKIVLILLMISLPGISQNSVEIYSNNYLKKEKLSALKTSELFESDSLILYSDGSFKNYYLYGFHDQIENNIYSGKWTKNKNELTLKPKLKLNDKNEILRNFEGNHSEVVFRIKGKKFLNYKTKFRNRKIKTLKIV